MSADIIEHFHRTEEGAVRRAYIPTHYYSDGNTCPTEKPCSYMQTDDLLIEPESRTIVPEKVSLQESNSLDCRIFYASMAAGLIGFLLFTFKVL